MTLAAVAICACNVTAQVARPAPPLAPARSSLTSAELFVVFLAGRNVGREEVALTRQADGWVLRGTSNLAPPFATLVRQVEVRYDGDWRPKALDLDASIQGKDVKLATTFGDGKATNQLTEGEASTEKVDDVSADAVVLPNVFFGGYAALAARLQGAAAGTEIKAYVAPQAEISVRVDAVAEERIETPRRTFTARRYSLTLQNPGAGLGVSLWTEASGAFVRLSVPAQTLEVVREDVASAAARMSAFSIQGDESVRIPANGFSLAATVTPPRDAKGLAPAVVLIGGSGPADRDGTVAGIPVIGQIAKDLSAAGFVVVRYDRRGVGQSGGRPETATLTDYAEDARAVVNYLRRQRRKEVDGKRVAVLGHSEGAWVAMQLAAREKDVSALVLVGAASDTGGALVLEQQQQLLGAMKVPDEEKKAKADLQARINAAATGKGSWDGIPGELKAQADTPWFASFLAFDPAKVINDVRQPILIVQGARDRQVPARHADRLEELARARKRPVPVEVARVEGVNHLLVPAATGEVSEYGDLSDKQVSTEATGAVARWLQSTLAAGR